MPRSCGRCAGAVAAPAANRRRRRRYPGDDDPAQRARAPIRLGPDEVVAVGSVLPDPPPWEPHRPDGWRIRGMATRRRRAEAAELGALVLDALLEHVAANRRRAGVVQRPGGADDALRPGRASRPGVRSSRSPGSGPTSRCGGSCPTGARSGARRPDRVVPGPAVCANVGSRPITHPRSHNAMPEAVIVATGRTPIGRANKGSLGELPPRRPRRARHQGSPGQGARSSTRP